MGRRSKAEPVVIEDEAIDNLVEELQVAEKGIADAEESRIDTRREDLVKASEEGYITQKVEYIKKCTNKSLEKVYKVYEAKRKKDADEFLTDLLISQFSSMLGGLDAIEDPKVLTDELKGNSKLRKDVENAISVVSPYIPLIGLLGGAMITGRHIHQHKSKQKLPPAEDMQIQSDSS